MPKYNFISLVRPYRLVLCGAVLTLMMFTALGMAVPWLLKIAIDKVIPNADYSLFYLLCLAMLIIYAARIVLNYISHYSLSYSGVRMLLDIRQKLFKHLQGLSLRFYEEYRTGKLISNVINDVALMQQLITTMVSMTNQFFLLVLISVVLLFIDPVMGLAVLLILPLHFFNFWHFKKEIKRDAITLREKVSEISANLSETLNGMRVVKSFAQERSECRSFFSSLRPIVDLSMSVAMKGFYCWSITDILSLLCYLLVIGLGIMMIQNKSMTLGEFVAFNSYVGMALNPVNMLSTQSTVISQGLAGATRIGNLLSVIPEIKDAPDALKAGRLHGDIVFKNVNFSYDAHTPVISQLSLTVKPGQKVALVGPSGCGKSTLSNLLLRFYEVNSGQILVDGVDIRKYSMESYRNNIGVVLQDPFLFSGTIRENIAYGKKDASDEEITRAATMANVDEFVYDMEAGYETKVGENGVSLSGGQKQRLAIARAILKDPAILILDEATSALDTVSEYLVQKALDNLMKNRSTLIIAHRLSTIKNADMIVVMENGEIVQSGTHDQLLNVKGTYSKLYETQQKVAAL
ncbi:MAG: ABC transporter ATP-binding protein [Victivallales bacterium]|nr:ABC transporter ATP-binding protein [Victivallales bacterium]